MGKIILNGKEYVGGGQTENTEFYHFSGEVWNSNAGTVKGRGSIDVTLTGGIARIDFDIKITASGTDGNEFLQGINAYLLQAVESRLPYITPIHGGWWKSSSDNPSTDYGSVFEVDYEFWKPARYYDASNVNAHGAWAENQFSSGQRIFGVCFGTYA